MIRKIFPGGVGNTPFDSFKVFLISEGYTADQKSSFIADCLEFVDLLLATSPFNLTHIRSYWLSVYSIFTASNNGGPAIDMAASTNRTAFESTFTSSTGLLSVNSSKVNDFIAAESLRLEDTLIPLSDFCVKGDLTYGTTGSLIVLLLPPIPSYPQGGEFEHTPSEDDYHFVAVSKNGLWHQLILRSIASCLGLGDEFELAGDAYLAPGPEIPKGFIAFNLEYLDSAPSDPITGELKWYSLFSATQRTSPVVLHPKTDPTMPDILLDDTSATPVGVEFWEGGGGFRTKMWRSAHDCLMRRRVGDSSLPVRGSPVPFCPACKHYLGYLIG